MLNNRHNKIIKINKKMTLEEFNLMCQKQKFTIRETKELKWDLIDKGYRNLRGA